MMSVVVIIAFLLLFYQTPIVSSLEKFCDGNKNHLLDTVFNAKDTVYMYRKPDKIWLLRHNTTTDKWYQWGDQMALKDLFRNYAVNDFDGAFVITDFLKCDHRTVTGCAYHTADFDASNVTFIFLRKTFYVFDWISERVFIPFDFKQSAERLPWRMNQTMQFVVSKWFSYDVNKLDGILYFVPYYNDKKNAKRMAMIFSQEMVREYDLRDDYIAKDDYKLPTGLTNGSGNGGFVHDNGLYFVIRNDKVVTFNRTTGEMTHTKKDVWQYFNCDSMEVVSDQLPTPAAPVGGNDTNATLPTTTTTPLMATNVTTDEVIPIVTESPTTPAVQGLVDNDVDYRSTIYKLIAITFSLIIVAMIVSTVLAYFGFQTFT